MYKKYNFFVDKYLIYMYIIIEVKKGETK